MFCAEPLTCNDVTRKFCDCHDRKTMGMSSSLTSGSPADWPRSSNNRPQATLTGTWPYHRKLLALTFNSSKLD